MITDSTTWPSGPVRLVWQNANETNMPTTGAHGFCFRDSGVLVCDINDRGLTIPGGHVDEGETPAECLIREASEEACVDLSDLRGNDNLIAAKRQSMDE